MSAPVTQQIKNYFGADGLPLHLGFIYFGSPGLNPEASPIQMYWDSALTIPAPQPFRTSGGYIMRGGQPANVFASGDFSSTVYDSTGRLVYTTPHNVDFLATGSLAASSVTVADVGGYYTGTDAEAVLGEIGASLASLSTGNVPTGAVMDYTGLASVPPSGWVLMSGQSIGSVASNATERNNADTSALYSLLWTSALITTGAVGKLVIQDSAGTPTVFGASAAADFGTANKRLVLPDCRGRVRLGMDKMGKDTAIAAAGRITVAGGNFDGTVMFKSGGLENHVMLLAELATHTHVQNAHTHTQNSHTHTDSGHGHPGSTQPSHTHPQNLGTVFVEIDGTVTGHSTRADNVDVSAGNTGASSNDGITIASGNAAISSQTAVNQNQTAVNQNAGSNTAFTILPPAIMFTVIIKL